MTDKIRKTRQFFWGGLRYDPKVFFRFLYHFLAPTQPSMVKEMKTPAIIEAIEQGKSFIRFGDGEMMILTGRDVYFQPTDPDLAASLLEVVSEYSSQSPYILGIPTNKLSLPESQLTRSERRIWRLYRVFFPLRFPLAVEYAPLTFFYVGGRFEESIEPIIRNRYVVCVSNAQVLNETFRSYAGTAFAGASFVETPATDAYRTQTSILNEVDAALRKNTHLEPIILFAAGPASKAWAHQYTKRGVQCLDLGHGMELVAHDRDRSERI